MLADHVGVNGIEQLLVSYHVVLAMDDDVIQRGLELLWVLAAYLRPTSLLDTRLGPVKTKPVYQIAKTAPCLDGHSLAMLVRVNVVVKGRRWHSMIHRPAE